jgi:hypothetical protein
MTFLKRGILFCYYAKAERNNPHSNKNALRCFYNDDDFNLAQFLPNPSWSELAPTFYKLFVIIFVGYLALILLFALVDHLMKSNPNENRSEVSKSTQNSTLTLKNIEANKMA